jgi:hypothetical protein
VDGSCEALIVAAERYDDAELRRLRLSGQDAGRLAEVLGDPAIGGFAVRSVIDQPTPIVTRAIQRFLTNRRPTDHLLLYMSCHAITTSDGRTYFAASNTQRQRLEATAISAMLLKDLIDQSQAQETILVLDCCHSRVSTPGSNRPQSSVMLELAGHTLLTASTAIEYTWAGDQLSGEGKPSVFTGALVEGLRNWEADADGDGVVSVRDLYQYLSQRGGDPEYHRTALVSATGVDTVFVCQATRRALLTDLELKDKLGGERMGAGSVSAAATSYRARTGVVILIAAGLALLVGAVVTADLIRGTRAVPRASVPRAIPIVTAVPTSAPLVLSRVVTVPGTQQWTDTGVDLEPGEKITIQAAGSVQHAPGGPFVGPDGDNRPELRQFSILPDSPHVALIGKVNTDGQPFPVGSSLRRTADEKGRLFLGVNDKGVDNNSGTFTASIEIRRG